MTTRYIGRFAPSPSGPLHFGSLVCALASFLDARKHGGQWLLRIDDIDPPREVAGADSLIQQSLRAHGLLWDGEVRYQSTQAKTYHRSIQLLLDAGRIYPCACNRKRLASLDHRYDGHCKTHKPAADQACALRLDLDQFSEEELHLASHFDDPVQGAIYEDVRQLGDFIIHRKDGLFAYQLASSVDDLEANISHIVRGSDLLDSAPKQRLLIQLLDSLTTKHGDSKKALPKFIHVPVLVDAAGNKLSKQNHAKGLVNENALHNLRLACLALGLDASVIHLNAHANTGTNRAEEIAQLLENAIAHWNLANIPKNRSLYQDSQ